MHEVKIAIPDAEMEPVASKYGKIQDGVVIIHAESMKVLRDRVDALLVELSELES